MNASTDRIERERLVKAPRSRVWAALADAGKFGDWFGVNFKGKRFIAGQRTQGLITHPGYENLLMDILVERVEPERLLSWKWHPYAHDPGIDYTVEQATLVVIELSDAQGGTLVRVVESGFDAVPAARRAEAYRMNSGGWEAQLVNIESYVAKE